MKADEPKSIILSTAEGWIGGHLETIIAILISLAAGWFISWFFFNKSAKGNVISYQLLSNRLLGHERQSLPKEIEIRFRGEVIERLNKSILILWNSGIKTIYGKDIVDEDKLRLIVANATVLDARVVSNTRKVIKSSVGYKNGNKKINNKYLSEVPIYFEYLDKGDGLAIELLYSPGKKNKRMYAPSLVGTIRGMPNGLQKLSWNPIPSIHDDFIAPILGILLVLFLSLGTVFEAEELYLEGSLTSSVAFAIISTCLFFLAIFLIFYLYRIVKNRPPKALRKEIKEYVSLRKGGDRI